MMSKTAYSGATIITADGVLIDHVLVVDGSLIVAIPPAGHIPPDCAHTTLPGGWLAPGFIDVQVNGGGGVLLNDHPTLEGLAAIADAHLQYGSTGIMPTLISDDLHIVEQAIAAVDAAIEAQIPGVLGLHIEGPFLNVEKRGIHDAGKVRTLDDASMTLLTQPGRGQRMVTVAPELAPAGAISRLRQAGIIVCAGHSLATYDQTVAALDEGLAGFTHLFNAMTQLGSRAPGMVGAALDDGRGMFGLIVDGEHVHPATLRIALAARGTDSAMLVTDAMPTVGAQSDRFRLGQRAISAQGAACRAEDGALAGTNLDMATAFANAVQMLGVSVSAASAMASLNPAKFLGLDDKIGSLAPGRTADFVHLDADLKLQAVWRGGRLIDKDKTGAL